MTQNAKKYLITTETHEIVIVRKLRQATFEFCPDCGRDREMLDFDAAIDLSGRSARQLFGAIEKQLLHAIETRGGHLIVCRYSLIGEIV